MSMFFFNEQMIWGPKFLTEEDQKHEDAIKCIAVFE